MNAPHLLEQIAHRVHHRTNRRVIQLNVAYVEQRIVLEGIARSYHVKQLAQEGVLEAFPDEVLENKIRVQS